MKTGEGVRRGKIEGRLWHFCVKVLGLLGDRKHIISFSDIHITQRNGLTQKLRNGCEINWKVDVWEI
jgi:hypothetical protein